MVSEIMKPLRFFADTHCLFVYLSGDMVPTTFIGKLIAFPAMMCGILVRVIVLLANCFVTRRRIVIKYCFCS